MDSLESRLEKLELRFDELHDQINHQGRLIREKNWASNSSTKHSSWFFTLDTKYKPDSPEDIERCVALCNEIMESSFQKRFPKFIDFNKPRHHWDPKFVQETSIKYCVEIGNHGLKKDGNISKVGGTIHMHVYSTVTHTSNISLNYSKVANWWDESNKRIFGLDKGYVSRPRLVQRDRVEEYMEKSHPNRAGKNEIKNLVL